MSQPLMPDQRFLDKMRGIHGAADYLIFEHKYGPQADELALPDARLWKPSWKQPDSVEPLRNSERSQRTGPTLFPTTPLGLGKKEENAKSTLHSISNSYEQLLSPSFPTDLLSSRKEEVKNLPSLVTPPAFVPLCVPALNEWKKATASWGGHCFQNRAEATPVLPSRKVCPACDGTGEPPGIFGFWSDSCPFCGKWSGHF